MNVEAQQPSVGRTFRAVRTRNYRLYLTGLVVSFTGTAMQTIGLGWLVLDITHNSGVAIGAVLASQWGPLLVFGTWGGVLADRFDRHRTIVITQSVMAMSASILAVLTLSGSVHLWMVILAVLVQGCAEVIDRPARGAFVPELVSAHDVPNAVVLNNAAMYTSQIVGPALAALIIATTSIGVCFLANAVSFVAVIGALALMRREELNVARPVTRAKRQIRDGFRYVWSTPALRDAILMMAIVGTFAIEFPVVMPLMAKLTFHGSAGTYSLITILMGVGGCAGAIFVAGRLRATGRTLAVSSVGFGIALCLAAVAPGLPLFLLLCFCLGAGQLLIISTCSSFVQLTSDPTMRGRVTSLFLLAAVGTTPVGALLVGAMCQAWGPRVGLAFGGVTAIASVALFGVPFLRNRTAGP